MYVAYVNSTDVEIIKLKRCTTYIDVSESYLYLGRNRMTNFRFKHRKSNTKHIVFVLL